MQTSTQRFQPDESVMWERREADTPTRRLVRFSHYLSGGGSAVVEFGHAADGQPIRYTVTNLAELSRPSLPDPPWFLPGRIEPPRQPDPLSDTEVTARLATRREALADAHHRARQARDAVASASTLAKRAETEHDQAKAALATLDRHNTAEQHAIEEAIRTGDPVPEAKPSGQERQYVVDGVNMCNAAHGKFAAELVEANATLNGCLGAVRKASLQVAAALFDRECELLRAWEDATLTLRTQMQSVAGWWPSATSNRHGPRHEAARRR
jgi:hypothetical protein